jgi:signal transduction histidine kinase/FixJ family two-component response regulator
MEITPDHEKSLKLLLVEDNAGDVYLLNNFLKSGSIPFTISHSSTLKDAIQNSLTNYYDVVLLDLGLPDSIGIETLKKMIASGVKIPIVVMTGLDDEEVALRTVKEGAQDYLVKNNITAEAIIRSIRYSIERKNIQDIKEKNTRQFSILSSATVAINECDNVSSIYDVVCNNIRNLLKDVTVCFFDFVHNEMDETDGCGGWIRPFLDKIDNKPYFQFNGKLSDLTFTLQADEENILPTDEKKNPYCRWYAVGFAREEKRYGGIFVFSQTSLENNDMDIIEAISNQAALSIHRRVIETKLKEGENRYRILFNEATVAKDALQLLNQELDLMVQERTREIMEVNNLLHLELEEHQRTLEKLKESAAHLKSLNAMKDKFFGIIAHDLRNPFSILLGSSELLMNYTERLNIGDIQKISLSIYNSAKNGFTLLENLLEWSRSQTGSLKFNPEKVNIRELVEFNIASMKVYIENKKIALESDITEEFEVKADRNMINTVMRNLLNNAVKFTHINGRIMVSASKQDNNLVLSVKDTGIGISAANIEKLFRIDTHFTNTGTAQERGTGLGLLLCKEFVEKHGGEIWVESLEGQGSEFKFSIPVNADITEVESRKGLVALPVNDFN